MASCAAQNSPHCFIETYPQAGEVELFNGTRFYICRNCGDAIKINLNAVKGKSSGD